MKDSLPVAHVWDGEIQQEGSLSRFYYLVTDHWHESGQRARRRLRLASCRRIIDCTRNPSRASESKILAILQTLGKTQGFRGFFKKTRRRNVASSLV
jgi:hypothetical protein